MKRFLPRLHLSTLILVFIAASLLVGAQFIKQEADYEMDDKGRVTTSVLHSDDAPSQSIEEGFIPGLQFGIPFTVAIIGPKIKDVQQLGYTWRKKGIIGNSITSLIFLIGLAAASEYIICRRTRRQLELEKK